MEAKEQRRNHRLVIVVRLLAAMAVAGVFLPLHGAFASGIEGTIVRLTSLSMVVLTAIYAAVLLLAHGGRWSLARGLLFSAWAAYPGGLLLLCGPTLPMRQQIALFGLSPLFTVMVCAGMMTLASWRVALRGMVAALGFYTVSLATVAARYPAEDHIAYAAFGLLVGMFTVSTLAAFRTQQHDLEHEAATSEASRAEAQALREAAADVRDQALAANTAKSRFLANMSHELRTPLNAILGYVELIQETADDLDVREFDEDLGRIHKAGDHLLGLINAILDLSKIEAGKMELDDADLDPRVLVHELISTVRPLAHQKDLEVRLLVPDRLPTIRTDGQKLRQVLLNLLANAVKFTDAGSIEMRADVREDHFIVEVVDSGVGISPARLETVFDAFERTEAEITRRVGGTGLGLAISKRLCELLGGDLTASSQVGRGSTFTVRVPTTPPRKRRKSLDQLTK